MAFSLTPEKTAPNARTVKQLRELIAHDDEHDMFGIIRLAPTRRQLSQCGNTANHTAALVGRSVWESQVMKGNN